MCFLSLFSMEVGQALSQVRGDSVILKCAACSLRDGSVVMKSGDDAEHTERGEEGRWGKWGRGLKQRRRGGKPLNVTLMPP